MSKDNTQKESATRGGGTLAGVWGGVVLKLATPPCASGQTSDAINLRNGFPGLSLTDQYDKDRECDDQIYASENHRHYSPVGEKGKKIGIHYPQTSYKQYGATEPYDKAKYGQSNLAPATHLTFSQVT